MGQWVMGQAKNIESLSRLEGTNTNYRGVKWQEYSVGWEMVPQLS